MHMNLLYIPNTSGFLAKNKSILKFPSSSWLISNYKSHKLSYIEHNSGTSGE